MRKWRTLNILFLNPYRRRGAPCRWAGLAEAVPAIRRSDGSADICHSSAFLAYPPDPGLRDISKTFRPISIGIFPDRVVVELPRVRPNQRLCLVHHGG